MKIYLSSTFEDLRSERHDLRSALADADYAVLSMEDYQSSDRPPLDKCFHDIEGSDLYLGVLSWRYGDVPKPEVLAGVPLPKGTHPGRTSFTEFEYRHAVDLDVPRLLFLASESSKGHADDTGGRFELDSIEALRRSMEDDRLVDTFSDSHELVAKVLKALQTHRQESMSHLPEDLKHRLREELIPVLETGANQRRALRRAAFFGAVVAGLTSLGTFAAPVIQESPGPNQYVTAALLMIVISVIAGMGWWKIVGCDHQLEVFRAAVAAGLRNSVRRTLSQMTCYRRFRDVLNDVVREIAAN